MTPLITNDAIVLGILMAILGFVFITAHSEVPLWKKFYTYVPPLLLCYFIPSVFSTIGLYSGDVSRLYTIASQYLLPTSLVLLTISIDLKAIARLGPKAVIMFLGGTVGIILGGPLAVLIVSFINPELVGGQGPEAVWRGLSTIAGSWIGGSANQTAMKEVYEVGDRLFSVMIAIDVLVANVWMACLLFAAGRTKQIDTRIGADTSAIDEVKTKVEEFRARIAKIPALKDTITVLAVGFVVTAVSHLAASDRTTNRAARPRTGSVQFDQQVLLDCCNCDHWWTFTVAFFACTSARRCRPSTLGSVLLYVLIATIGMKMNILAIFDQPALFLVGSIWMAFHAITMLLLAWLIKAPLFFLAVGSQANVGGAASAPVVASAFHPALAPVGVLLAVPGYALGTYGGWLSGQLMRIVAPE